MRPAFLTRLARWPRRAVPVSLLVVLLASAQGCYHYQVSAAGPAGANPSTFSRSTTLHAVLWGLLQDQTLEHVCAQDEALARVRTTSNFGYTLLTVLTLGIWAPVQVEYACANPTPATGTIGGGQRR
jgi:Bor protein